MSICIQDYLHEINIWPKIRDYVLEHKEKYELVKTNDRITTIDQQVFETVKRLAKHNLKPSTERDNFRHAITGIYNGTATTITSENIYRLLFVLNLENDIVTNNFLIHYLNRNELSARNMDEFIIICALRLNLSWEKALNIRDKYNSKHLLYPIAPNQIVEGQTYDFYQNIIAAKVTDINDLEKVLEDKNNYNFWAKTRNTHYLALFYDIAWDTFNSIELDNKPLLPDTTIKLYEMTDKVAYGTDETPTVTMKEFYNMIFGMHSADDPTNISSDVFLTSEEINSLASVYPNAFLTYDTFCDLVQRRRNKDITQAVFLIRILEELDPNVGEDEECINFSNKNDFLRACNNYLLGGGFPSLQPNNIFSKLILDIYDETQEESPKEMTSLEFKRIYFDKLRFYLKQIAALKK